MALVSVDTAQISELTAGLAKLKTDTSKSLSDIATALKGAVATADPATAATITQAVADLATLDTQINAADPAAVVTNPPA